MNIEYYPIFLKIIDISNLGLNGYWVNNTRELVDLQYPEIVCTLLLLTSQKKKNPFDNKQTEKNPNIIKTIE